MNMLLLTSDKAGLRCIVSFLTLLTQTRPWHLLIGLPALWFRFIRDALIDNTVTTLRRIRFISFFEVLSVLPRI